MATKISTELLIMILNNVQSTRDLYSSLLVNRIWCKVAIPILWKLPLNQERCYNLKKKALCIRTYISCMDTRARTLLTQNGFDLSSSPSQATFDYPSFTHKLIINNLVYFIYIYLLSISSQQIIGPDDNNNSGDADEEIITKSSKSKILFREICKLIINQCTFLDSFKMTGAICLSKNFFVKFLNYSDLIGSILKLPGAPKVFKKLKSFTSTIGDYELIYPLYDSLALICDNILKMDLELNSHSQMQLLEKLISVQKRLEDISIVANYLDCNSLLWAIISQKETLKRLRLKSVNFYSFKKKSSPIGQFISLQELYIKDCSGLYKSDCLLLALSFTRLSSIHCFHRYPYSRYPQEFIIKILETANINLRNICLDFDFTIAFDTLSAILNYCTKITKLTLLNLSLEQVIAIFNNNFNELRRFSFDCEEEFDANELFYKMAEDIPESLEIIEISMGIFSADSLRKFFEGWCRKGGGENKEIIVKRTEQAQLFTLSDEHFEVIEEYGVAFKLI